MSGTLDRLIRILSSFDAERPAMTVAALARRADLPLPTAYRWVERLVGAELLQKDDDGLVRPGLRLWEMASRSAPSMSLARTAMPFLVDVRSVLRQNTQLAVLDDEGVLVLERLSSQGAVVNQAAAQGGGNPLIPALKALRAQLPAGSAVHMGATSQDIIDTALMAMAAQVGRDLGEDLRALAAALARLAREHRGTPMVARSLAQHSLPSTFGLRAANWLDAVGQAAQRLEHATAALPVQWGGAAGTMASLAGHVDRAHRAGRLDEGVTVFTLVEELADRLGLSAPAGPWDTNRMAVTGVAAALADVTAACGKIANDVLLSSRIENSELGEPLAAGRGGSSAMPHKQNPVLSVLVHSAALSAPGMLAQVYTAAGAANDERPDGAWHAEWPALRQLLRVAGGAASLTRELAEGLRVNADRMAENLAQTGPVLVSERLMAELAPAIDEACGEPGAGKAAIQGAVDDSLAGRGEFRALLREAVPDTVSDDRLDELLDPAGYTGEAGALVDRILAAHAELIDT